MKKIKKKKAMVGTIISLIGTAAGIASGITNSVQQQKLAQEQRDREQALLNQNQALADANVLSQEQNNQQYVQQMNSRVSFKCGGKKKIKKANLGVEWKDMNTSQKLDTIGGIGNALSSVVNLGLSLGNKQNYNITNPEGFKTYEPKIIKQPNIYNQNPILAQAKLGCKKIKKRNINRFK